VGPTGAQGAAGPQGVAGTTGQNTTTVFGTAGLVVTSASPFTLIPGLTQVVTVPASSRINMSTDGGVQTTSGLTTGFSSVDIVLVVDGLFPANGGYRRILPLNNGGITGVFQYWAISQSQTLTAGNHTIQVFAAGTGIGSNANVSGNNTSVLQGELTVEIQKL
jgi:hypothetical protein